jgi:beta-glucanase (GH16 family)
VSPVHRLIVLTVLAVLLGPVTAAHAGTFRFPSAADTYAPAGGADPGNGTRPYLQVASMPATDAYVRFHVGGLDGPVQGAYLELHALSDSGPAGVAAHGVAAAGWDENSLAVPALGPEVDATGSFAARSVVYLDVTPLVTGDGTVDAGLSTNGWTTRWFASRESPTPPRLIVQTAGAGADVTAPAEPAPVDPSGEPMPAGDIPSWRQVFADDFTGRALGRGWGAYSGQPQGDPGGWWDPSHTVVAGGAALLRTYRDPALGGRWVSGGMSSAPALKQTYGKYLVRFRMDPGFGIAPVLLLFPSGDHWPPEIDFAEDGGTTHARDHLTATLHYGVRPDDRQIQRTVYADFTRWHTMGVEWTPGRLVYTLDGSPWATVTGDAVPAEPMELDLQTQAGTEGDPWTPAPDASTPPEVDMQVDWVVAYAPAQ